MRVHLQDGTGYRDYRFVVEDVDRHGNIRIYFRRKGHAKVRLAEAPGTPEFDREHQRAFRGEVRPAPAPRSVAAIPGTMRWLCEQYYASAAFQALGDSTRKVRRGILDSICERAGSFRFSTIEPHNVAKLRDEKAA